MTTQQKGKLLSKDQSATGDTKQLHKNAHTHVQITTAQQVSEHAANSVIVCSQPMATKHQPTLLNPFSLKVPSNCLLLCANSLHIKMGLKLSDFCLFIYGNMSCFLICQVGTCFYYLQHTALTFISLLQTSTGCMLISTGTPRTL